MTKEQAIQALYSGDKVSHRYFSYDEYLYFENGYLYDERGNVMGSEFWDLRKSDAWQKDWFICN